MTTFNHFFNKVINNFVKNSANVEIFSIYKVVKNSTKTAKKEVISIFKQLNKDEIDNLLLVIKERKETWKEYNNTEYLNLLNQVESIMDELLIVSQEE